MEGRVTCTDVDCHTTAPHMGENMEELNKHTKTLTCQVCHIPTFSNELPTKLNGDWSTTWQDIDPIPPDEYGKATYSTLKGNFVSRSAMRTRWSFNYYDSIMPNIFGIKSNKLHN